MGDSSKMKIETVSRKTNLNASRRLYSFEEARKIARGHGFDSKDEFIEYECAGAYIISQRSAAHRSRVLIKYQILFSLLPMNMRQYCSENRHIR